MTERRSREGGDIPSTAETLTIRNSNRTLIHMEKLPHTSRSTSPRTQELIDAVDELIEHGHDDLPLGPASPLGDDVHSSFLTTRPEREIRHVAKIDSTILGIPSLERE